jgi:iron complex transport system substrate-binding protein
MKRLLTILALLGLLLVGAVAPAQAHRSPAALVVTGDDGVRISLPHAPARLISLAPSVTEVLFALGLGPKVVGVDADSNYPKQALALPKIASYTSGPLYEKIVALKPALIVAAQGIYSSADIAKLRSLHLAVLVTNPTTIADVIGRDLLLVGTAAGVPARARRLSATLEARIQAVEARVKHAKTHPTVYYELDNTYYTVGHGSFMDSLITMAGGINIAGKVMNPYPQLSAEKILVANPQFIILGDATYGTTVASVEHRPGWSVISAVKLHHIYPFNDDLASRPGPRIVLGLETLAHILHPELFK